jgi:hypothetical protein
MEPLENYYYVYHLINPITNLVFYVGKGAKNRCYQHLKDTLKTSKNKRLWGYINNLRKKGYEPNVFKIQENLNENYAYQLEEIEIKKYGRKGFDEGGILMNIVEGGKKPPTGFGEENNFYGKKHSEETKQKISRANTGRKKPKTEKAKENSRVAALDYWSEDTVQTQERKQKLGVEGRKYWEGTPDEIEEKKEKLRKLYEKTYKIVYPDGSEEIVVNLKQACIERGFNHSLVYKVMQGKRNHHKGCKFYKVEE